MTRRKVVFPHKTIAKFDSGGWKIELIRSAYVEGAVVFFNVVTMRGDGKGLRTVSFTKPEAARDEFSREKKRIAIMVAMDAMGIAGPRPAAGPSVTFGWL